MLTCIFLACMRHVLKTPFSAYLNEDIYIVPADGFAQQESNHDKKVCKLRKLIYSPKEAAHAWNQMLAEILLKTNFKQSMADTCLFTKKRSQVCIAVCRIWIYSRFKCCTRKTVAADFT